MRNIQTIDELNDALLPYVPLVAQLTGKDTVLDRIRPLMALLGNPQNHLKTVHIAGTSGKTSTSYYIAALLRQTGANVGLTVSPHIDSVTERVQLNGSPLSDAQFCSLFNEFMDIVDASNIMPSYFELLYAFSIWTFNKMNVDYAVVETGLGGLHDATNIIDRADKICVITDIGLDHMHILGDTVEQISLQKAGIMHSQNTAIMYEQSPEITDVFKQYAAKQHAHLILTSQAAEASRYGQPMPAHMPLFQQRNWLLAHGAYTVVAERDALPSLDQRQLRQTQAVQVPARMDIRTINGKTLVMDGAHNDQKMASFLDSMGREYPNHKLAILIALKHDKHIEALGPLLARYASRIIVTTFATSQDLPVQSVDPEQLADIFRAAGVSDVTVIAERPKAYQALVAGTEDICVITGSFYLISQLRHSEI